MRKRIKACVMAFIILCNPIYLMYPKADVHSEISTPENLYGQSALLMDATTGRVLYEKNGYEPMPMASTTKIMTCLVALENSSQDDHVIISSNAAAQPDVQMNICTGEEYVLGDLLRGMMLESYNDVAVAVSEHVGGTVEGFAAMMNEKAVSIGCTDTHFITPNGLDATDEGGIHSTTAKDLALILSEAIKNDAFLAITQTKNHTISECNGKRTATANNKNALLHSTEGAISGKTGFTGKAGYCYAGAVSRDNRTLVAVTLGSGWPPHKQYKWKDMNQLFQYGFDHFHYQTIDCNTLDIPEELSVLEGKTKNIGEQSTVKISKPQESFSMLLRDDEHMTSTVEVPSAVEAPIKEGDVVGEITYSLNGKPVSEESLVATSSVEKIDFMWNLMQVLSYFFVINL